MSVVLLLLVLLFVYLLKDVPKNYKLYKAISSMEGFVPNPSYLVGHAWYLWIGYKSGYVGLQGASLFLPFSLSSLEVEK